MPKVAQNIVLLVYYFPPLSSSGAKRMEALAKYFTRAGRHVTVLTPVKNPSHGLLSEEVPSGIALIEMDRMGRRVQTQIGTTDAAAPVARGGAGISRRIKDLVLRWFGQVIDPRMPFAWAMVSPALSPDAAAALRRADVVVATCPPWPPLLAAVLAKRRFGMPIVLDYRDQFSACHEMPGSRLAKWVERVLDRYLTSRADAIVTVSEPMRRYYASMHSSVRAVLNGFDADKIAAAQARAPWQPRLAGAPLVIRYLGLVTAGRIPHNLLAALDRLRADGALTGRPIRFEYYGECQMVADTIATHHPGLAEYFSFHPAVPYDRALELVVSADHLLFCEQMVAARSGEEDSAAGILPTKLYEYLASGRPILANIPTDTLAGSFVGSAGDCHFASTDTDAFAAYLMSDVFWNPPACPIAPFVQGLSREAQTADYLAELDRVVADGTR